jgi:hypothetical protein
VAHAVGYDVWRDRTAKQDLLRLRSELRIGATRGEVIERFHRGGYRNLRLVDLQDEMTVQTPIRLGALNWDLWLTFEKDRLTSVQVRDADGRDSKPSQGPPDIVERGPQGRLPEGVAVRRR